MAGEQEAMKRILPHSDEAETSVIGSMIMDREAIEVAAELISGEDFYNPMYGTLYTAMVELNNSGSPVDLVTLQNRLREKNVPPEVCSLEFIQNILNAVPTAANIRTYTKIVYEKAVLRRLIRANEGIAGKCYQDQEDLEDILNSAERSIFELVQNRNTDELTPIRQVVMNQMEAIEAAYHNKGEVTGIATGFTDLDYKTAGMHPSDLVLIAARPAMGKTAFVLNITQHMVMKLNKAVAIFSLEMSKEQLINRMFSLQSSVEAEKLRTGKLSLEDWNKLSQSANELGNSRLMIDDTPSISVAQLRSKCRKMKMKSGLDIIIIDYLQLMSGSGKSESRQNEVAEISRALKGIARELDVPVIALSQLSRAVEKRDDKRPMLSDLRESGSIEQDADLVMFIYRDDYYNKDDSKEKGISEIIIAKQRNGSIGTVKLAWLPEYTKFANLEHKLQQEQ